MAGIYNHEWKAKSRSPGAPKEPRCEACIYLITFSVRLLSYMEYRASMSNLPQFSVLCQEMKDGCLDANILDIIHL